MSSLPYSMADPWPDDDDEVYFDYEWVGPSKKNENEESAESAS